MMKITQSITNYFDMAQDLHLFIQANDLKIRKKFVRNPGGSEFNCQCRRRRFDPWVREDPLEMEMATYSSILAWEIPWTSDSPWDRKKLDGTQGLNNSNSNQVQINFLKNCPLNRQKTKFQFCISLLQILGASRWLRRQSACNAGDSGLIPGPGRSPGEGNGNQLQHSCLKNPMDRGAQRAAIHGVEESQTRLSD